MGSMLNGFMTRPEYPREALATREAAGIGNNPGRSDPIALAKDALEQVKGPLSEAASTQEVFTAEQLDCISGIETGRTWDPDIVAENGRVGLFQFDEANWLFSGTTTAWEGGKPAKDPFTAAKVALALLYRKLGYKGVENPTADAVKEAIDKFGEHDSRYGQAVMDCANKLAAGDFSGGMGVLQDYANWVKRGRP
jgi:hypothetical protein